MANLSQLKREKMLKFLEQLKQQHADNESIIAFNEIENELKSKKYGLIWEQHEEKVDVQMRDNVPVFTEVKEREIIGDPDSEDYNFLIEGDNLHSLYLLKKTHKEKIDVIYIDPPYNRGKNDFMYDDNFVDKEDTFKHSKWLSFMEKRLKIAKDLLSNTGVIIINIDEHEKPQLLCLLYEIFGENNDLGEIIWNKKNPKGDAQGISNMHETIFCFAKNKEMFLTMPNVCTRDKINATAIIKKASKLFNKKGKRCIPDEVSSAIKPFNFSKEILDKLYVTYDLELINNEFKNWISRQPFSNGEKAYKFIDESGRVYRGVSMAWPNKKKAPSDYFIPLIHPITKKACPIPERGWRNSSTTMKRLLEQGLILFGKDETKQPERKYFLDENMQENMSSIYDNGDSADKLLSDLDISFEYPKPVSEAMYVCKNIHPTAKIFLDFFAGSGTTGHAILNLNNMDGGNRKFILCTNNQNNICEKTTYTRIKNIINGYAEINSLPANLKYYKTSLISKSTEELSDELLYYARELIQLEHGISIDNAKYIMVVSDEEAEELARDTERLAKCNGIYISDDVLLDDEEERAFRNIPIHPIPRYYFEPELLEVNEI